MQMSPWQSMADDTHEAYQITQVARVSLWHVNYIGSPYESLAVDLEGHLTCMVSSVHK